ncbi:MAG: CAAX prenyl protease-related protein [Aeoliella sp.]
MTEHASADRSNPALRALLAFVLPIAVYMLVGSLEPEPAQTPVAATVEEDSAFEDLIDAPEIEGEDFSDEASSGKTWLGFSIPGRYYPAVYTVKIVATLAVLAWFFPVYLQWPIRVSPLAIVVGVVGVLLWIGCCWLNLESHLVNWLGEDHAAIAWLGLGARPAYNPFNSLGYNSAGYAFLAVRFFGLALLVPIIEEAFLRAFLMRFVMHDNWTEIPFGTVSRMAIAAGILFPVLYHPEKLAALVWFSLVTWLMIRTKNFWDCVAAHAVTNLLLGIYVVTTGAWELW